MRLLYLAALSLACGTASLPRAAAAQTTSPRAQDSALVEEVRRLISARVSSTLAGDSATLHRLLAPGYIHVYDSGARNSAAKFLEFVGRAGVQTPMPRFTVTQVAVRREGSVLLADALVTLAFPSPAGDLIARAHDLNALVRVHGRWRFAHHSETPVAALAGQPVVAAPDSGALGQFVGDYEVYPGAVDRIIQRGARLIMQDRDHPGLHDTNLVAAGAESFYPENESQGLMVFVRDTTGRVTHYIMRIAGGPVIISRRVR